MRRSMPNAQCLMPKLGFVFFVSFAAIVACMCMGCGALPGGQAARAETEIEAGPGATVEATTEQDQEESSVEAADIAGSVETHRYGPSPEQKALESERLAQASAERVGVYVILGALILLALAAPNVFPASLTGTVFVVAIVALLAGALLPNIVTLLL